MAEKYNVSNIALEQILTNIKSQEIAIPEIQRPFVWKPKQVRDLIDSLYAGYPTGYLGGFYLLTFSLQSWAEPHYSHN